MKASTNPFDFDFDENEDTKKISGNDIGGVSTNPFDDDDDVDVDADEKDDIILTNNNESRGNFFMNTHHHGHHDNLDDRFFDGDAEKDFVNTSMNLDDVQDDHPNDEIPNDDDIDIPVEDSWQFLGDLPYRRVPLYNDIVWGNEEENQDYGLAFYSPQFLEQHHQHDFANSNLHEMLLATTVTKITGCPMGGPVASVTIPVSTDPMKKASDAVLRIMTSSGRTISTVQFPPVSLTQTQQKINYSAADILTIGFTNRTLLMIVLRDSLCLTFDLQGNDVLPPFYILPQERQKVEVLEASVFEGGVAVLGSSMTTAIVELLDNYDDPSYVDSAHMTARRIFPKNSSKGGEGDIMGSMSSSALPQNFALVTTLPTAAHAR